MALLKAHLLSTPRDVTISCDEYCEQGDRQDGLSGSVSSDNAEVISGNVV
jgi:hypothetical protein